MQLTKTFSGEDYRRALHGWTWLPLRGKEQVFTSLFGDVFLEAADGWWRLDTLGGDLTRCGASGAEVMAALDTTEGEDRYLHAAFARDAARRGVTPAEKEVYAFAPPPALSGSFDGANIVTLPYVVAHTVAGQLHQQVRNMPPGARADRILIDGVDPGTVEDPRPVPPEGRKRWFRR